MVTHNEMFLHTLATRFVVFDRDRVVLYDRTYQDFLDEVGWEMDESLAPKKSEAPPQPVDRKAARQARAKLLQDRTRVLGPLEKTVEKIEKRIARLESEATETLQALEAASVAGERDTIAKLSRRNTELKSTIEALYADLEAAVEKLDVESARFDGEPD